MLYGKYCYIIIENIPQKFSPCIKLVFIFYPASTMTLTLSSIPFQIFLWTLPWTFTYWHTQFAYCLNFTFNFVLVLNRPVRYGMRSLNVDDMQCHRTLVLCRWVYDVCIVAHDSRGHEHWFIKIAEDLSGMELIYRQKLRFVLFVYSSKKLFNTIVLMEKSFYWSTRWRLVWESWLGFALINWKLAGDETDFAPNWHDCRSASVH